MEIRFLRNWHKVYLDYIGIISSWLFFLIPQIWIVYVCVFSFGDLIN